MHRSHAIRCAFTAVNALCFSVLLVACGNESGDQQSGDSAAVAVGTTAVDAGPADACVLLPAAEVQQVVGVPVRDSLALSIAGADGAATLSQCNYATADNAALVSVMLQRSAEGGSPATASQGVRQSLVDSKVEVQDVAGLGDIAIWGGNQLHVFAPMWHLTISPVPSGGLEQARSLAVRAVARL